MLLCIFALFVFGSSPARAYLPPAHYLYAKIAEQKAKTPVTSVTLTLARPLTAGTEEILGTYTTSNWKPTSGGWPSLSLLFEADNDALIRAVSAFGLTVPKESDLLRVGKDQLSGLKDPPRPFYRVDRTMSLQRSRQTYAWVHSNKESGKAVWVEKDSFLPLKISGPCPAAATTLAWAKSGENKCELEFRNLYALKRGNLQSTRLTLWKDGLPVLFFTFERVAANRPTNAADQKLPVDVQEIAEIIFH